MEVMGRVFQWAWERRIGRMFSRPPEGEVRSNSVVSKRWRFILSDTKYNERTFFSFEPCL
jgi:hypothetical protein